MKAIGGKYLLVLIATSLGILTNTAGLFFSPIAEDFGIANSPAQGQNRAFPVCEESYPAGAGRQIQADSPNRVAQPLRQ